MNSHMLVFKDVIVTTRRVSSHRWEVCCYHTTKPAECGRDNLLGSYRGSLSFVKGYLRMKGRDCRIARLSDFFSHQSM